VLSACLVAVAQESATPSSTPKLKVRIPGLAGFETQKEIEIKEAVLVNTLSVFIGKTGFVRQRSGILKSYVFLSTQELGCNRVEAPVQTIGAGARKPAQSGDAAPSKPPVAFTPKDGNDIEVRAIGFLMFDPKEMEKDPTASPFFYRAVEGRTDRPTGFEYANFAVGVLHRDLKDGRSAQFTSRSGAASPKFAIIPRDGQWYVKLSADDKKLGAEAEIPVKKCPSLESVHIEPK
jgi:hypothetical protein